MPLGTKTDRDVHAFKQRIHRILGQKLAKILVRDPIITDRRATIRLPGDAASLPEPAQVPRRGPLRDSVGHTDPITTRPGDILDRIPKPSPGGSGLQPGDGAAEHELELVLPEEDLWQLIQEAWHLPDFQPTDEAQVPDTERVWNQRRPTGPPSRWLRRKTLREYSKHQGPLQASDLRYRQYDDVDHPLAQAVVFLVRDISGSMMDEDVTRWVRATAFVITLWLRQQYPQGVEIRFCVYDTRALPATEAQFFGSMPGGGTMMSSALDWLTDQQRTAFPPTQWNGYMYCWTDGEDFQPSRIVTWLEAEAAHWRQVGLIQTVAPPFPSSSSMASSSNVFTQIRQAGLAAALPSLVCTRLCSDEEVRTCLIDLFGTPGDTEPTSTP